MKKGCKCKDWQENMPIINSAISLAFTHGFEMIKKHGSHCLWCGKELEDVE